MTGARPESAANLKTSASPTLPTPLTPLTPPPGRWAVALAGMLSLAVAMGIGRFAFTPLLPMMLADGVVDLPQASWLASANYLGYLLGAVLCTLHPWIWARFTRLPHFSYVVLVRAGLLATGVLTLAMALPFSSSWPLLRFAAGVTSAVVFVFVSGWCLSRFGKLGVPQMGGLIFVGPGAGIVISGLLASAMVAWDWRAQAAWLVFGVLAFALAALVWPRLHGNEERLTPRGVVSPDAPHRTLAHGPFETTVLALAYGLAGFGYIITATFLPVIARAALPGSVWLDLFWPIFGFGVMTGAVLSSRIAIGRDPRWLLAGCYLAQGFAILISVVSPTLAGFALGSLLLGIPFTAITFFALQEVRRLRPDSAASFMGLLTALYGAGQVVGPPLAAALLRRSATASEGFAWSLGVAASALLVGALMYAWLARRYPMPERIQGR